MWKILLLKLKIIWCVYDLGLLRCDHISNSSFDLFLFLKLFCSLVEFLLKVFRPIFRMFGVCRKINSFGSKRSLLPLFFSNPKCSQIDLLWDFSGAASAVLLSLTQLDLIGQECWSCQINGVQASGIRRKRNEKYKMSLLKDRLCLLWIDVGIFKWIGTFIFYFLLLFNPALCFFLKCAFTPFLFHFCPLQVLDPWSSAENSVSGSCQSLDSNSDRWEEKEIYMGSCWAIMWH